MGKENVFFGIDDYMAMYSPYIKRVEARELAQCYVVGLMMDGDRMLAAEKIRPKIAVVPPVCVNGVLSIITLGPST